MATSFYSSITDVMTLIMTLDPLPTRVLDVGIGTGKYGLLCREYLTYWQHVPNPIRPCIDGIEPAAQRLTPLHHALYDHIFTERAETFLPTLPDDAYDLALILDAIEHIEKPDGAEVLRQLQRIAPVVILSTPSFFYPQGATHDNIFARHHSFWSVRDLNQAGACCVLKREATIAVFAREPFRNSLGRRFEIQSVKNRWLPARLRALAHSRRSRP